MREIFTIPDPDLTQESSVDPMGLQVIWTAYGQVVFGDKLTTIANDMRVFSFNLFHNHLIYKLYQDFPEEIEQAKHYYKSWQTQADVKTGLLIFLEDLVTHTFYLHEKNSGIEVDKLGILGSSKARIVHHTQNPNQIFLAANKRKGLLKNQINLGMTGRYKGPMMNMEFFDRSFTYLPKTWERVDNFMQTWGEAMELEKELSKLIIKNLLQSSSPKKEFPQISLQDLKANRLWRPISDGYLHCFGSRKLPKELRKYWQDKLGLLTGAPMALYDEISQLGTTEFINHQRVFSAARKKVMSEPSERIKIDNIINLEPFLSHCEYLLRYLAQPGIKSIVDEKNELEILRKQIIDASKFSLENAQTRLINLHTAMLFQGDTVDWITGILIYHKKVMERRGGNMWLELDPQNNIKHYFAPILSDGLNTIPKYLKERPWWHTYYLETLRSIYKGLN